MSGDPMKLVKFMCATKVHNTARSESALTIHEGVWAFCYAGGQMSGHDWQAVDGLPLNDAMRFAQPIPAAAAQNGTPAAAVAAPKVRRSAAAARKDSREKTR